MLGREDARAREALAGLLSAEQRALFESMHPADRRHGLDVMRRLRADGWSDPDLLVAGLLHDAGKGRTGLWPRVAWSLGERYGRPARRTAEAIPGLSAALRRLDRHAELSADLAVAVGCSARTADLIRHQDRPTDQAGAALLRADEAS